MKELIALITLTDIIEISIIFVLISMPLVWLSKNSTYALEIVYGVMALWLLAYHYPLPALQSMLYIAAPCSLFGALLIHKDILQRSYLVATSPICSTNWIELCVKSFIQTKSNALYDYCVIEGNQSLESFLQAYPLMSLAIGVDVLELIGHNTAHVWWITKSGTLRSVNATVNVQAITDNVSPYESLCMIAFQTDCCVLIKKNDGSLTLLYANKRIEHITLNSAVRCIRQHVQQPIDESIYDKKIYKEYSI